MKVNASFEKKSTNSYSNFKTCESAHFNEPYVAAVFNTSFVNDGFNNFTLGKMIADFVIFSLLIFCSLIAEFGFYGKYFQILNNPQLYLGWLPFTLIPFDTELYL